MVKFISLSSRSFFYVLLLISVVMSQASCTKNYYFGPSSPSNPLPSNNGPVSVTSFSPLTGPKDILVTINGAGFSRSAANNIVSFNGVRATVISATATKLIVNVPKGSGDGKISVSTGGPASTSPVDFKYQYTVTTLAGDINPGFADGTGPAAQFSTPYGIVMDATGNLIVTDFGNGAIRKITPAGAVTSLNINTNLNGPIGITMDALGNIYVADPGNLRILKITPSGTVSTLTGGPIGFAPANIIMDPSGTLYISNFLNERIHKLTSSGQLSIFTGSGIAQYVDGPITSAEFYTPLGMDFDAAGNLYIADADNNVIRKIIPAGIVSTFAGNGTRGYVGGPAANAQFNYPVAVKVDAAGNMFVADSKNHVIRKITPAGIVGTVAGGSRGYADGIGLIAKFNTPSGIAIDGTGTIYVADAGNNCIRKIE